jgi:hypothetical protein
MTVNFNFDILDASHALLPATTAAYIRGVGDCEWRTFATPLRA